LNAAPCQSSLFVVAVRREPVRDMHDASPALLEELRLANASRANGAPDAARERRLHLATGCDHRLAVYGTLAPGGSNHAQVADLGGRWRPARVRGRRAERTWPVFTWDETEAAVAVQLLESERLPARWPRLDEFEGPDYRRVLVLARTGDAAPVVANLYSAVVPVAGD